MTSAWMAFTPLADEYTQAEVAEAASPHKHILELPGIGTIDVLRKQSSTTVERRPVGVAPDHRAEIRPLDVEAAAEVHLVGLDDAGFAILQHPNNSSEHSRRHLQSGRILIGREASCLLDRELRAVPVGVLGMAIKQHAELVDAVDNFVLCQDLRSRLSLPLCARQFVQRQHCVVARAICVMTRWPVHDLITFT